MTEIHGAKCDATKRLTMYSSSSFSDRREIYICLHFGMMYTCSDGNTDDMGMSCLTYFPYKTHSQVLRVSRWGRMNDG